jgi:DMSO/TMAO reductase YedYZ molybdopterin-dependent catalytic subunit
MQPKLHSEQDAFIAEHIRRVVKENPLNIESPLSALEESITSNDEFFVRSHFPQPEVSRENWQLRLEGAVKRPVSISLADLQRMPAITVYAVLECAGNGRLFLGPETEGILWELGAVGCARWTGVPVKTVLDAAGALSDAAEVVFEGADHGTAEKHVRPTMKIAFARSVPMDIARSPQVILAYKMNGADLPAKHGAPVRLIVPGWYGTASVKWLERILVTKEPFRGYFQTVEYAYWKSNGENPPELVPLRELRVKSEIARPLEHEQISVGTPYTVRGAAWTSDAKIRMVEVSTDAGKSWHAADVAPAADHAWQVWQWTWKPESSGKHILMSRATDSKGRTQPASHDANYENYAIHHTLPIEVEVI